MQTALFTWLCIAPVVAIAQDFGTKWNDPYIPQPKNFVVRGANAPCDFQVVYDRFAFDNRYDVQYLAEYSDGSRRQVNAITGTLARDQIWFLEPRWRNENDYGIQALFFRDICKGNTAPTTFRIQFVLRSGFTYQNRYTTGSLSIVDGSLPGAPANVRVTAGRSSTVSWSAVEGATSYIALVEYLVDSEVGPIPSLLGLEVEASATSVTYNRRFTRAAVIAVGDGLASGDAKRISPLDDISDVTPA